MVFESKYICFEWAIKNNLLRNINEYGTAEDSKPGTNPEC